MAKITWTRPSGSTIETDDDPVTIKGAETVGWVRTKPKAKAKSKTK